MVPVPSTLPTGTYRLFLPCHLISTYGIVQRVDPAQDAAVRTTRPHGTGRSRAPTGASVRPGGGRGAPGRTTAKPYPRPARERVIEGDGVRGRPARRAGFRYGATSRGRKPRRSGRGAVVSGAAGPPPVGPHARRRVRRSGLPENRRDPGSLRSHGHGSGSRCSPGGGDGRARGAHPEGADGSTGRPAARWRRRGGREGEAWAGAWEEAWRAGRPAATPTGSSCGRTCVPRAPRRVRIRDDRTRGSPGGTRGR